ncbi:MAG: electron transport complex subunit RsxC [Clostridia bacterium]|nr:electron transport complex subunit RsxC [Clostridia bacterium]
MAYTFKGGIRPDDHKYTKDSPITRLNDPDTVSISLSQHVGVMCRPVVKVGDSVKLGQLIGDIPGGLGCPVHSSVSGKVIGIEEVTTTYGGSSYNIVIENDKLGTLCETVHPFGKKLSEATFDEILAVIRNAGIAGMGGTAFPTYAKIAAARGKVDSVIINCCEGEPFVTVTRRMILESLSDIMAGIKIIMVALGVRKAYIAIEKDRKKEIKVISNMLTDDGIVELMKVSPKYPSGSEKHLVYALKKKELSEGKTAIDAGCVVFSAETCAAVACAFTKGLPLIRRVITVDGDCIANPGNFEVPIGTGASYIIEKCGGLCKKPKKIIFGGPLMGHAQWDVDAPVSKTTSAILVFSDYFDRESRLEPVCIRCGRCVGACPMGLMPLDILALVKKGRIERAEALGAAACIECGSCTHVCPGGLPVTQYISRAKTDIMARRRSAASEQQK